MNNEISEQLHEPLSGDEEACATIPGAHTKSISSARASLSASSTKRVIAPQYVDRSTDERALCG
jgi:hypothetical protein